MFASICHAKPSICGCELRKKAVGDVISANQRSIWLSQEEPVFANSNQRTVRSSQLIRTPLQ